MMHREADIDFKNEHTSCASQENDTYKKVCKVDRRGSLKKHTQGNQQQQVA